MNVTSEKKMCLKPAISVAAIVPALNEGEAVDKTVQRLVEVFRELDFEHEIVVVDDGSADGTSERIRPLIDENARIKLIRHEANKGLAASFYDGVLATDMHYCIKVHGDFSDPKESLIAVLKRCGEADMVIPFSINMEERTLFRRAVSRLYTWLVNLITGYRVQYYNGTVLHRTETLRALPAFDSSFAFQAEAILRQLDHGATFTEVGTVCDFSREAGSYAFRLKNIVGVSSFLLRLLIRYRIQKSASPAL